MQPPAPTLSQVAGGAKFARTAFVRTAYIRKGPDGTTFLAGISPESSIAIAAGNLLKIAAPVSPGAAYDGWVPMGTYDYSGATKQNFVVGNPAVPLAFGTPANDWTEAAAAEVNELSVYTTNNMDMELGNTNYWKRTGGTSIQALTGGQHSGTYRMQVDAGAGATVVIDHCSDAAATILESYATAVGDVVKIAGWIQGSVVSTTTVALHLVDGGGADIAAAFAYNPANAWNYFEAYGVVATAGMVRLKVTVVTSGACTVQLDDLTFKKMSGATKYANFEADLCAPRYGLVAVNLVPGVVKWYPRYAKALAKVQLSSEYSSSLNNAKAQETYLDGYIPMIDGLTPLSTAIPAYNSGITGGGTGGGGFCQKKGSPGVSFQFGRGAKYIIKETPAENWCRVRFVESHERHVTPGHRYRTPAGLRKAAALMPGDLVWNLVDRRWDEVLDVETYYDADGIALNVEIIEAGEKLSDVDDGHHYGAGGYESHNVKP